MSPPYPIEVIDSDISQLSYAERTLTAHERAVFDLNGSVLADPAQMAGYGLPGTELKAIITLGGTNGTLNLSFITYVDPDPFQADAALVDIAWDKKRVSTTRRHSGILVMKTGEVHTIGSQGMAGEAFDLPLSVPKQHCQIRYDHGELVVQNLLPRYNSVSVVTAPTESARPYDPLITLYRLGDVAISQASIRRNEDRAYRSFGLLRSRREPQPD